MKKKLTIPNAGEDMKQQDLSRIVGGNANLYTTFKDGWAMFYKAKHSITMQFALLAIYLTNLKKLSYTKTSKCIYNSLIYNCQNLNAIKMPLDR